jgi:hypothetical protein
MRADGGGERLLVAGADHDPDLLNAGLQYVFQQNHERGLGLAVAVHQRLQGQIALVLAGRSDDSFSCFHSSPGRASGGFIVMGGEHTQRTVALQAGNVGA